MKKFFILFAAMVLLSFSNVSAKSSTMVGGGIGYGLDIEELAIQAGAVFDLDLPVNIAPDFKYYLVGDTGPVSLSMWELNVNAHYNFNKSKSTTFYGIAGLQYANISTSVDLGPFFGGSTSSSSGEIGLNIGAGANFDLGGFNLMPEIKYTLGGTEQLHIGASAMFAI